MLMLMLPDPVQFIALRLKDAIYLSSQLFLRIGRQHQHRQHGDLFRRRRIGGWWPIPLRSTIGFDEPHQG